MKTAPLVFAVVLLCACGGERHRYRLAPQLEVRRGDYDDLFLGLQGQELDGDGKPVPGGGVPSHIGGLEYRWGVVQTVEVRLVEHDPVLHVGTVSYALERVLSEEPVPAGTPFTLRFAWIGPGVGSIEFGRSGQALTIDGYPFTCASDAACDAVEARVAGDQPFLIEGQHAAAGQLPLITGAR